MNMHDLLTLNLWSLDLRFEGGRVHVPVKSWSPSLSKCSLISDGDSGDELSCFTYTTSWPPKPSPTMMWVPYFSMKLLTFFRKSEISLQWIVGPSIQEMETAFGHGKSSGLCCFCLVSGSIVTCSENWSSR
jgi:hypothetical protein